LTTTPPTSRTKSPIWVVVATAITFPESDPELPQPATTSAAVTAAASANPPLRGPMALATAAMAKPARSRSTVSNV